VNRRGSGMTSHAIARRLTGQEQTDGWMASELSLRRVGLIELRDYVVEGNHVGRHRQKFETGLVRLVRARQSAAPRDAEQLDVTTAIDIDGEHADRPDGQTVRILGATPRSAHLPKLHVLT